MVILNWTAEGIDTFNSIGQDTQYSIVIKVNGWEVARKSVSYLPYSKHDRNEAIEEEATEMIKRVFNA